MMNCDMKDDIYVDELLVKRSEDLPDVIISGRVKKGHGKWISISKTIDPYNILIAEFHRLSLKKKGNNPPRGIVKEG